VAFPAMLPATMAVAAVGRLREFPSDSSHVLSVLPHLIGSDDVFAAGFSAAGPQVAVSAPGVAVVSTVPGGGYAAADRTSAAAAHVTGLAALVLAHHPAFQDGLLRARSEQRVHALFELIRASAVARFAHPQHGTYFRCHFTAPMHLELVAHVVHVILDRRRFDPQLAADLLV